MQTQQGQVCRVLQDATNRLCRLSAGETEAELLVLVGGGDVFVGVCLDADGDADHDGCHDIEPLGRSGHPLDLIEGVDDDAADSVSQRSLDLGNALVVAVEADSMAGKTGSDRHGQLTAGADVQPQALLVDPPRHRSAQERLAGVVDVGAAAEIMEALIESLFELLCTRPEVVLVNDVCRCAEVFRDLADVEATDGQSPPVSPMDRTRPQRRDQSVHVLGGTQPLRATVSALGVERASLMRSHQSRSGDETPSRPRPLARTTRVASLSHSRVRCRSVISSPASRGRTRHSSYHLWKWPARSSR